MIDEAPHDDGTCPSCGREYSRIPYRERMMNGSMGHLEMDDVTGATILVEEQSR